MLRLSINSFGLVGVYVLLDYLRGRCKVFFSSSSYKKIGPPFELAIIPEFQASHIPKGKLVCCTTLVGGRRIALRVGCYPLVK